MAIRVVYPKPEHKHVTRTWHERNETTPSTQKVCVHKNTRYESTWNIHIKKIIILYFIISNIDN